MEVGAVKQAFNNELILLKKKLNQAKIQIIHKLTRKSKTLIEKKAPENLKEKLKRKATAAVNEVLIIKKIKPKDLAKFIITHKGELNSYLNKPNVDQDKACARLLLHKSLQDKYKFIRSRFSSVPIDDLLMSREERKKIKKEAKEKQKNKKKAKGSEVVNAEGDWDVEDIEMTGNLNNKDLPDDGDGDELAEKQDCLDDDDLPSDNISDDEKSKEKEESSDDEEMDQDSESENESNGENGKESDSESKIGEDSESDDETPSSTGKLVKIISAETKKVNSKTPNKVSSVEIELDVKPKSSKLNKKLDNKKDKHKQSKNKNLNEKLLSRKFKKDVSESPVIDNKVVDPFFITSTGENYMSVVEPRPPDEVKEIHKQGNRKIRRAAMFGHVPKIKPRNDNFAPENRFNKQNGFDRNNDKDSFGKFKNNDSRKFTDKRSNFDRNEVPTQIESKPEKLHPSWEAKKRQSGIKPFQGKKIVFDES